MLVTVRCVCTACRRASPYHRLLHARRTIIPQLRKGATYLIQVSNRSAVPTNHTNARRQYDAISYDTSLNVQARLLLHRLPIKDVPKRYFLTLHRARRGPFPLLIHARVTALQYTKDVHAYRCQQARLFYHTTNPLRLVQTRHFRPFLPALPINGRQANLPNQAY